MDPIIKGTFGPRRKHELKQMFNAEKIEYDKGQKNVAITRNKEKMILPLDQFATLFMFKDQLKNTPSLSEETIKNMDQLLELAFGLKIGDNASQKQYLEQLGMPNDIQYIKINENKIEINEDETEIKLNDLINYTQEGQTNEAINNIDKRWLDVINNSKKVENKVTLKRLIYLANIKENEMDPALSAEFKLLLTEYRLVTIRITEEKDNVSKIQVKAYSDDNPYIKIW